MDVKTASVEEMVAYLKKCFETDSDKLEIVLARVMNSDCTAFGCDELAEMIKRVDRVYARDKLWVLWAKNYGSVPTSEDLYEWLEEGGCSAVDDCYVEPDGYCQHGFPSWLIVFGMI